MDLTLGLGELTLGDVRATSPPTVMGDVVAVGTLVADNQRADMPGGGVHGYDARSGALRWAFDPAPPGMPPLAPAPGGSPRFQRGTPNAWGVFTSDPARDLLFVPTGNPSHSFTAPIKPLKDPPLWRKIPDSFVICLRTKISAWCNTVMITR